MFYYGYKLQRKSRPALLFLLPIKAIFGLLGRKQYNRPPKGVVCYRSFTTLSVACLVRDKCRYRKENKEELRVHCPCRKLSRFFCQFLSVDAVLGENCRLYLEPCSLSLLPHGRPHTKYCQLWTKIQIKTTEQHFPVIIFLVFIRNWVQSSWEVQQVKGHSEHKANNNKSIEIKINFDCQFTSSLT